MSILSMVCMNHFSILLHLFPFSLSFLFYLFPIKFLFLCSPSPISHFCISISPLSFQYYISDKIQGHVVILLNPEEHSLRAASNLLREKKTTLVFIVMLTHSHNQKNISSIVEVTTRFLFMYLYWFFISCFYFCFKFYFYWLLASLSLFIYSLWLSLLPYKYFFSHFHFGFLSYFLSSFLLSS